VYKHAANINGVTFASRSLPTSDISNPDLIYSPTLDILWYPSAYPSQTGGGTFSTPIRIWTAASTRNNVNPDILVPYTNGQGTAAYDSVRDYLYVANVNGPTLQVYQSASLMTSASMPAASITLTITDGGVSGTPRAADLLYDPVNDRLFVSDQGTVVAAFDGFGAIAASVIASGALPANCTPTPATCAANREILTLTVPFGMAYAAASDVLWVAEGKNRRIDVIHNASSASGPNAHGQLVTGFSSGPTGMAFDSVRDLLFVYDPIQIWVIPSPESASGPVSNVNNRRQIFDASSALAGFGIAVDSVH
jgi:hypothetical protein